MKVHVVRGDFQSTQRAMGVLSRAHDVHVGGVPDGEADVDGIDADAVVLVWPSQVQGRSAAARLVERLDPPPLAVVPVGLTADRLGIADAGVDYIVDPYHPMELVRQVELRAGESVSEGHVEWAGDTRVDEGTRLSTRAGHDLDLTRKEFDLLAHLVRNQGQVQSRAKLLNEVWSSTDFQPNVIEVAVSSLRRKMEELGPRIVHTVRGVGYVIRIDRTGRDGRTRWKGADTAPPP